jgi:hypothetical protein
VSPTPEREDNTISIPEIITRNREGKGEGFTGNLNGGLKPDSIPSIKSESGTQSIDKKSTGLKTKFLGLSLGGWIIIGLVLVWAGVMVGMIAGH